ncbi:MAG: HAMP domain-containing histidine kinase, partial [Symploca sp. SIO2B6]|nr:HAMP domain-containing histidine kinase [Symploca sp. SIO2B6]
MTPSQHHKQTPPVAHSNLPVVAPHKTAAFVSLRVKLLIGFSFIFSVVFAGAFLWFYNFTTDKTITRLREDLRSTLEGAAAGVDVEELMTLYREGEKNEVTGFSDDPRYQRQLDWFTTVQNIEPRAWLYSFVVTGPQELEGQPPLPSKTLNKVPIEQYKTVWLVDLWAANEERDVRAAEFLEETQTSSTSVLVKYQQKLIEEENVYQDEWGTWLSAFAPLTDESGQVVAILGLDIEAAYVFELQDTIRERVLMSFIITYGILFVLIYVLSGILTKNLTDLTHSAERIGVGDYRQSVDYLARLHHSNNPSPSFPIALISAIRKYLRDEMSILAQAFEVMIAGIQTREQMIREGKAKEDKMRRDLEVATELNALKSRFVSIVSHEFRTPLTVLRTSTELLEHYGHKARDEQKKSYYQRIRAAISNMTQLLEDVLVVGQSDAGKLEFKPIPIDLKQFCHQLCEDMQHSVGLNHTIHLTYHTYQTPLAQTLEQPLVSLDPNLLRPILSNLLSNAIKYSDANTTVNVSAACYDSYIVLEVTDAGIGIPADDQPHLFELFHRASNVDTIRGTGLGLAIVKQCCDRHHGTIRFTSEENEGTTFTVKLPIVEPNDETGTEDDVPDANSKPEKGKSSDSARSPDQSQAILHDGS